MDNTTVSIKLLIELRKEIKKEKLNYNSLKEGYIKIKFIKKFWTNVRK